MTHYTTVTSKGQVTIPAAIRKKLGIVPGQKIAIESHKSRSATIQAAPSIEAVRSAAREHLEKKGLDAGRLRSMAEAYEIGDGMTTYVEEKYGQPRH